MQLNPNLKTFTCSKLGIVCEPEVKPAAKVEAKAKFAPDDNAFWNTHYVKTAPTDLLDEVEYMTDPIKHVPECDTGKTLHLPNVYLQKADDKINTNIEGSFDWYVCRNGKSGVSGIGASKSANSEQSTMTADIDGLVKQGQRIQTFVNKKLTN